MKWNNISNQVAPVIAFNIDNLLFLPPDTPSFFSKIKNAIIRPTVMDRYFARKVNQNTVSLINSIWTNNEVSVYLITFTDYEEELDEFLYENGIYHTRLVRVEGIDNLRRNCKMRYMYYFDNDIDLIHILGVPNAKKIDDVYMYLKV